MTPGHFPTVPWACQSGHLLPLLLIVDESLSSSPFESRGLLKVLRVLKVRNVVQSSLQLKVAFKSVLDWCVTWVGGHSKTTTFESRWLLKGNAVLKEFIVLKEFVVLKVIEIWRVTKMHKCCTFNSGRHFKSDPSFKRDWEWHTDTIDYKGLLKAKTI